MKSNSVWPARDGRFFVCGSSVNCGEYTACCLKVTRHPSPTYIIRFLPLDSFPIVLEKSTLSLVVLDAHGSYTLVLYLPFTERPFWRYSSFPASICPQNIRKMIGIVYLCLTAIQDVHAQTAPSAIKGLPSPPASLVSSSSAPLGNAALWQQALTLDAASNNTGKNANQYFYSSMAWWQSLENSSNSYLSGSPASIDAGPYVSKLLQTMQSYPTRFDQAQASDPHRTPSKSGPDEV